MIVKFEIPARGRTYAVEYREGALDDPASVAPAPPKTQRIALVADATTAGLFGHMVARSYSALADVETFVLPPGEGAKQTATLDALWRFLAHSGLHRGDLVIALGGGVVTDLAGFAAATFHRGIEWMALPTTLLGMVDAAIGGKTAIDLPEGKNLAGAFHAPSFVLADPVALQTLPDSELRTGLAEVIKHGLISTGTLLPTLEVDRALILARDPAALAAIVPEAARVKVEIVSKDETEQGQRAFLNYGHTLAHAIEAVQGYAGLTHGEAVAVGLRFVARLARRLGFEDLVQQHDDILDAFELPMPTQMPSDNELLLAASRDKKYDDGLVFVVLEKLGHPKTVKVEEAAIRATLAEMR